MCLYPKLIQNKKYTKTKKNGGNVPVYSDARVLAVAIGCGRCMECVKKKAREWQVRLLEDVRKNKNGKFVTFTFSNESIKEIIDDMPNIKKIRVIEENGKKKKIEVWPYRPMPEGYELDNAIATVAMRRFNERWRKKYKKAIRHWMVTELGHNGTENIHMHGIVWTDESKEDIAEQWKYGYTWTGKFVSEQTVNYIIKYVHKVDKDHKEYKSKVLSSAGIGSNYLERVDSKTNEYKEGETRETYRTKNGHDIAMPIYWRNKIYTDEEREKLWLEKLDKEERFVNGIRVDVSKGMETFYKIQKEAQARAKRLGYQDDRTNWKQKVYEEERRKLLTDKRIANVKESLRGIGTAPDSAESINGNGLRPNEKF